MMKFLLSWIWKPTPPSPSALPLAFRPRLEFLEGRTLPSLVAPIVPARQASPAGYANNPNQNPGQPSTLPDVGVAADGSFDVVWTRYLSGVQKQILVERFQADGTPQAVNPTLVVATLPNAAQASLAVRNDGSLIVAYIGLGAGNVPQVLANRYDANGNLRGGPVTVFANSGNQATLGSPDVAVSDGTGEFVVAWRETVGTAPYFYDEIHGRAFTDAGTPINATDILVSTSGLGSRLSPSVAITPTLAAGGNTSIVICYVLNSTAYTGGVKDVDFRRFDANLNPLDIPRQAGGLTGTSDNVAVAVDASQNFVVTWDDNDLQTYTFSKIMMRRFNGAGLSPTANPEVVDSNPGQLFSKSDVAKASDGRFLVAYVDSSAGGTQQRIAFRQYGADGRPVGGARFFTSHTNLAAPAVGVNAKGVFAIAADDKTSGQYEPWVGAYKELTPFFFALGGAPGQVEIRKSSDGSLLADFAPFGSAYTGVVTVAVGDVSGDGFDDLVVGTAAGASLIKIYNGAAIFNGTFSANPEGNLLAQFAPYAATYNVGVNVAVGDVNGDGYADVVTGAMAGNPHVKVYDGKGLLQDPANADAHLLASFFAYDLSFNVGVNVAVGDVNGDGYAEVVTGATVGNPHVKVYDGQAIAKGTFNGANPDASLLASFFAYGLNFNIGAYVAVGDVDGDGYGDIITGAAAGNPQVKVYNGKAIAKGLFSYGPEYYVLDQFFAYDLQTNTGVAVGAADVQGTGKADILTGATNVPHYRLIAGNATGINPPALLEGISSDLQGGICVGV
jgi:hypothetical protein